MAVPDLIKNYRFVVEIDGSPIAGFSHVHVGAVETDVLEYRNGNDPGNVRKLPGLTKYANIALKVGATSSRALFEWHKSVATGQDFVRTLKISILSDAGTTQAAFVVSRAWPVRYEIGELCANGNEVMIEMLELVNEGIERVQ